MNGVASFMVNLSFVENSTNSRNNSIELELGHGRRFGHFLVCKGAKMIDDFVAILPFHTPSWNA